MYTLLIPEDNEGKRYYSVPLENVNDLYFALKRMGIINDPEVPITEKLSKYQIHETKIIRDGDIYNILSFRYTQMPKEKQRPSIDKNVNSDKRRNLFADIKGGPDFMPR